MNGEQSRAVSRRWVRIAGLALVLFVLPIAVFAPATPWMIEQISAFGERSASAAFFAIILVFCVDAVALIPNGLVGTLAARALDWPLAALAVWGGLNLASCLIYGLGYFAGRPLAARILGADDLAAAQQRAAKVTSLILFATRPVPVIGETILIAAGIARFPFRRFILAVGSANVIMTATYVGLGTLMDDVDPARIVLFATAGIPIIAGVCYLLLRVLRPGS